MPLDQTLSLLFPLQLGGVYDADLAVEATSLDTAQASADMLLEEMFAYGSFDLLERWEKTYGLSVSPADSLQIRRNRVVQKLQELGALDIQYFIQLAAGLGFVITIAELMPLMPGWMGAGEEVMSQNIDGTSNADWCWRVSITSQPGFYFRAGESVSGESLSYSYHAELEALFNELKPADTFLDFVYF